MPPTKSLSEIDASLNVTKALGKHKSPEGTDLDCQEPTATAAWPEQTPRQCLYQNTSFHPVALGHLEVCGLPYTVHTR